MKKKVIATILSLGMVLPLAACGSTETSDVAADDATSTAVEEASIEQAEDATEETASVEDASSEETEEVKAEVTAEEVPDALYHFTFDEGVDEGIVPVKQTEKTDEDADNELLAGATYAITEDDSLSLLYSEGTVGDALYVNGEYRGEDEIGKPPSRS